MITTSPRPVLFTPVESNQGHPANAHRAEPVNNLGWRIPSTLALFSMHNITRFNLTLNSLVFRVISLTFRKTFLVDHFISRISFTKFLFKKKEKEKKE